jgi:hypothetical protein
VRALLPLQVLPPLLRGFGQRALLGAFHARVALLLVAPRRVELRRGQPVACQFGVLRGLGVSLLLPVVDFVPSEPGSARMRARNIIAGKNPRSG